MSLNVGVIAKAANGSLIGVDIPIYTGTINFNGGTPVSDLGQLILAPQASGYNPDFFVGGLGYIESGALVVDSVNAIEVYTNSGLPFTEFGLATEVGDPASYTSAGVPLTASGRVAISGDPPLVLSGFSDGFDDGFGATP